MSELKPCPFCGSEAARIELDGGFAWGECMKCGATSKVVLFITDTNDVRIAAAEKSWDTRPIENALIAKIAELEAEINKWNEKEEERKKLAIKCTGSLNLEWIFVNYKRTVDELARLREERRWRKCSELPEDKQLCEVVDKYGDVSLWIYSGALKMIFLHKFKYWRLFEYPPGQNVNHQNTK